MAAFNYNFGGGAPTTIFKALTLTNEATVKVIYPKLSRRAGQASRAAHRKRRRPDRTARALRVGGGGALEWYPIRPLRLIGYSAFFTGL